MFLVGLLQWWYGQGWLGQLARVKQRLETTLDLFSIPDLLRTFFAPFRQISAGQSGGSVGTQLRAFFDQTISRVIGSIVRGFTIITGVILLIVQALWEVVIVVVWLVLPLMPVLGALALAIGWVPQWR